MEANFWHQKWESNQIGFHESDANALFVRHFKHLDLPTGARLFLPLCGKTRDIAWLLDKGYRVVGAELSEIAIQQLFADLDATPNISEIGELKLYQAEGIDMYVGDIFNLTQDILSDVDAIYDRAALVALPTDVRVRYTSHLLDISKAAPQLLICFQYDQALMSGPPFSIVESEVLQHYAETYQVDELETIDVDGGFKGVIAATETAWFLVKK